MWHEPDFEAADKKTQGFSGGRRELDAMTLVWRGDLALRPINGGLPRKCAAKLLTQLPWHASSIGKKGEPAKDTAPCFDVRCRHAAACCPEYPLPESPVAVRLPCAYPRRQQHSFQWNPK